jgi:hypothetical protein
MSTVKTIVLQKREKREIQHTGTGSSKRKKVIFKVLGMNRSIYLCVQKEQVKYN